MQLQQKLDCCHIKRLHVKRENWFHVHTNCPTTLGEDGCLHLVVHTSFLLTRCTVSPPKSSKKTRCTTYIPMRFLLTILASQDPRPGCLRSHGRAGTTTLTRTVSCKRGLASTMPTEHQQTRDKSSSGHAPWMTSGSTVCDFPCFDKKKSTCPRSQLNSATPRLSWRDLRTSQTPTPTVPHPSHDNNIWQCPRYLARLPPHSLAQAAGANTTLGSRWTLLKIVG